MTFTHRIELNDKRRDVNEATTTTTSNNVNIYSITVSEPLAMPAAELDNSVGGSELYNLRSRGPEENAFV